MPSALTPLANITLANSTTSSVTFSSISGSYRDLMLVISVGNGYGNNYLTINGDTTAANYFQTFATGASAATSGNVSGSFPAYLEKNVSTSGSVENTYVLHFLDYAATDKHKTSLLRFGAPNSGTTYSGAQMSVQRWASTAAITSIAFTSYSGGTFATGSTFALYGVSA